MQYKLLTISAFAAGAMAQSSLDPVSVLAVLQTALPSSLIQEAITNSAEVSSQIASEFSAGQTPTWFTALPSDIQTYLVPLATNPAALGSAAGNVTGLPNATAIATAPYNSSAVSAGQSSVLASIQSANSSVVSAASTGTSSGSSGSMTTSGGSAGGASASASSGSSGASSSSKAGASMPTAAVGMGIAGIVGIVGVLAL